MTKLILTRHGHVEGIHPERFRGRIELELTELGTRQAARTAAYIAENWTPSIVYSSPMQRCRRTAEEVARACGDLSVVVTEDLHDLDYGAWQWRTHDEVQKSDPESFGLWRASPHLVRFPQGEALQDLVARTADALRLVLEQHPGKTIVFVGHDSVNRALLLQLLDQPLSAYWRLAQDPCDISEVDIDGGGVKARRINEIGHLHDL